MTLHPFQADASDEPYDYRFLWIYTAVICLASSPTGILLSVLQVSYGRDGPCKLYLAIIMDEAKLEGNM